MAKSITTLNYQETAKGRRIWAKAELAVAEALSVSRYEKGYNKTKITKTEFKHEGTEFRNSYFYTTDQFKEYTFGFGDGFYPSEMDRRKIDSWNIESDVDLVLSDRCWFPNANNDGFGWHKMSGVASPVSVKTMNYALISGNISIELETYNTRNPSIRREGWLKSGKVEWYAICIGHKVLVIEKSKLVTLSAEGHWKVINQLNFTAHATNEGRLYDNARNQLIPVSALIEHSRVMDLPEWYTTSWDKAASTTDEYKENAKTFWNNYNLEG